MKYSKDLLEIYCGVDDFCKGLEKELSKHLIKPCNKKDYKRACLMSDSEIITPIIVGSKTI